MGIQTAPPQPQAFWLGIDKQVLALIAQRGPTKNVIFTLVSTKDVK